MVALYTRVDGTAGRQSANQKVDGEFHCMINVSCPEPIITVSIMAKIINIYISTV